MRPWYKTGWLAVWSAWAIWTCIAMALWVASCDQGAGDHECQGVEGPCYGDD